MSASGKKPPKDKSQADKKGKRVRDRTRKSKDGDYDVGYKKPPKSGQIKPGERRNPNGRPKGSKNFNTILRQLLEKPMTMVIDGNKLKVSGREAIAYRVFQKAVSGDAKCIDILRSVESDFELQTAETQSKAEKAKNLSKTDEAILADYKKSILKQKGK